MIASYHEIHFHMFCCLTTWQWVKSTNQMLCPQLPLPPVTFWLRMAISNCRFCILLSTILL